MQKNCLTICIKNKEIYSLLLKKMKKVVGAIMSGVKPWFDGNRLIDTELFVDKNYQNRHLARELYKKHLLEAQRIYNTKVIEFHTYGDENQFPQNWYRKIGFQKDKELIIMNGNIKKVLEHLEPEKDLER